MKFFIFLLCFGLLAFAAPPRVLQVLRLLSPLCSSHGYLWNDQCFCLTAYTGPTCSQRKGQETSDDAEEICDDLINRLDDLNNISPDFYLFDDDEFPRLAAVSSVDGSTNSTTWIRMHDMREDFHIFSEETSAYDVGQGGVGNCYFMAAIAGLANRKNGSILKEMFVDLNDNPNHVYVTRWLVNGKPRFVAVDDWIPGSGTSSRFARLQKKGNFWPLILEKAYAKIHGTYARLNGGVITEVWRGITQALTFKKNKDKLTPSDVFDHISDLFRQDFVVGFGANLHAYALLGTYEITTDSGSKVKLVRYFNPWHKDSWKSNPWGDKSSNWTKFTKSQVPHRTEDDGIAFTDMDSYYAKYGHPEWVEIREHYDTSFIDIANNYDDLDSHRFVFNFTYYGDAKNEIYIYHDQGRKFFWFRCERPVKILSFSVINENGTVYKGFNNIVKIVNPLPGRYIARLDVKKNYKYVKFFTMTAYGQDGKVSFTAPPKNDIIDLSKKQCPNNCNLQGRCNTVHGTCICYFGYQGVDCEQIRNVTCSNCSSPNICDQIFGKCMVTGIKQCPSNCSQNGVCSFSTGKCVCGVGFVGDACDMEELPLQCPKNCSNHGTCDSKTGYCNCQNGFLGQACDYAKEDIICPNKCSGNGVCSFDQFQCLCRDHFKGSACENFEANNLVTAIQNVENKKYISNSGENIIMSDTATKWNLTSNKQINLDPVRASITVWAFDFRENCTIRYTKIQVPARHNQLWIVEKKNNYFFIRSLFRKDLALSVHSDGTKVTLNRFNENDPKQQWLFTI